MKPSKKEIIEHFKDAEIVADVYSKEEFNINEYDLENIELGDSETKNDWIIYGKKDRNYDKILFDYDKGYAKILTYKKPKFVPIAMKCNQEQFDRIKLKLEKAGIKVAEPKGHRVYLYLTNNHLSVDGLVGMTNDTKNRTVHETWNEEIFLKSCGIETESSYAITKEQVLKYDMREEFPEVFELKVPHLFTGWLKDRVQPKWMVYLKEGILSYGFDTRGYWFDGRSGIYEIQKNDYIATHEEVFEALESEAVRRYKEGDIIKCPFWEDKNYTGTIEGTIYWASGSLCPAVRCKKTNRPNKNFSLFYNGKWATIIETITKEEAEKLLNKKIV